MISHIPAAGYWSNRREKPTEGTLLRENTRSEDQKEKRNPIHSRIARQRPTIDFSTATHEFPCLFFGRQTRKRFPPIIEAPIFLYPYHHHHHQRFAPSRQGIRLFSIPILSLLTSASQGVRRLLAWVGSLPREDLHELTVDSIECYSGEKDSLFLILPVLLWFLYPVLSSPFA